MYRIRKSSRWRQRHSIVFLQLLQAMTLSKILVVATLFAVADAFGRNQGAGGDSAMGNNGGDSSMGNPACRQMSSMELMEFRNSYGSKDKCGQDDAECLANFDFVDKINMDFGLGCKAHDMGTDDACQFGDPQYDYCEMEFTYVTAACEAEGASQSGTFNDVIDVNGQQLYYSYEMCRSTNCFECVEETWGMGQKDACKIENKDSYCDFEPAPCRPMLKMELEEFRNSYGSKDKCGQDDAECLANFDFVDKINMDFGLGCKAHDMGTDDACQFGDPQYDYCEMEFTYVTAACEAEGASKSGTFNDVIDVNGQQLYYSYEMCNSTNCFECVEQDWSTEGQKDECKLGNEDKASYCEIEQAKL